MTALPKSAPLPMWSRGSNCRSLFAALKIHIKVTSLHCTMEEKILLAQMSFVKSFLLKENLVYILVYFFLLSSQYEAPMYVNTAICLSSFVNGIRNNANPFWLTI